MPDNPRRDDPGFSCDFELAEGWLTLYHGMEARNAGLFPESMCKFVLVKDPGAEVAEFSSSGAAKRAARDVISGKMRWERFLPIGALVPRRDPVTVEDIGKFDREITSRLIQEIPPEEVIAVFRRGLKAKKWVKTGEDFEEIDDITAQLNTAVHYLEQVRGKVPIKHEVATSQTFDLGNLTELLREEPAALAAFKDAISLIENRSTDD